MKTEITLASPTLMFVKKMRKVKPDTNVCYDCIDWQLDHHIHKDCSCCERLTQEYELLSITHGLFGKDYAYILKDGAIRKVKLDRISDVRDIYREDVC